MVDYRIKLIQDLPKQFREKANIEALLEVIGEQLNQVQQFYDSLNIDRALATAKGVQLDRIGDILVLSRLDAGKMLGVNEIIEDDLYRRLLTHKTVMNFGSATYSDIMGCIKIIHGSNRGFKYTEEPKIPATIIIESDESAVSDNVQHMLNTPVPKAAGVGICIRANDGADFGYGFGLTSQAFISKELDTEVIDENAFICFSDETENWFTDEDGNILLFEDSIETGIAPEVDIIALPDDETEDTKNSDESVHLHGVDDLEEINISGFAPEGEGIE